MIKLTGEQIKSRILRVNDRNYAFILDKGEVVDMKLLDVVFNYVIADLVLEQSKAQLDKVISKSSSSGAIPYFDFVSPKLHLVLAEDEEELRDFLATSN